MIDDAEIDNLLLQLSNDDVLFDVEIADKLRLLRMSRKHWEVEAKRYRKMYFDMLKALIELKKHE